MRTIDQMINQEVHCCLSYMVSTLAKGYGNRLEGQETRDLQDMIEQAFELASPVPDYEEAAIQAGWELTLKGWTSTEPSARGAEYFANAQDLCETFDIEPYEWEVYEHWAVSEWLADKLLATGEKVDKDFGGLCVWARTTTGQAISMDSAVAKIYAEMMAA